MKVCFLFLVFSLCAGATWAQQRPHYTQYVLNNYILNPALSGIENYADLKISGRDQWVGLQGAPRTSYLSVHAPLGKKDYKTSVTSFQVPGQNPRGTGYWENYTASQAHHGVGFTMLNDKTGLYNRFSVAASYAYHLGLSAGTNLALGFSGGLTNFSYNMTEAQAAIAGDPALATGGTWNKIRPDLGVGIWLYSAHYFLGVSGQQIIPKKVSFLDDELYAFKVVPHFFATAGYRFLLNEDINALPSVMVKYVSHTPSNPQVDLNVKLQYQDFFWLGGSYRMQDGYAAMAGVNLGNTVNFGYAYDFTRTALNTVSRGTHEMILGFLIGNRYGDTCPRNVW
ncbi:MAG TPA: type IX secretion system membrane protein PorP/SprF [Flavisolibacter sp.]